MFVNGTFVGNHKGGYSAFTFDVTDYVHAGRNLIAVSVDNSHNPDIAPLSADFTFLTGNLSGVFIWCILLLCNCLLLITLLVGCISKHRRLRIASRYFSKDILV